MISDNDIFRRLINLEELSLERNKLTFIHDTALPQAGSVSLTGNRLSSIPRYLPNDGQRTFYVDYADCDGK